MYTNSQIKDKTIVSRKGKKHLLFTNDYNYLKKNSSVDYEKWSIMIIYIIQNPSLSELLQCYWYIL